MLLSIAPFLPLTSLAIVIVLFVLVDRKLRLAVDKYVAFWELDLHLRT